MFQRALDEGFITIKWTKVTVAGPPKSGRSSLISFLAHDSSSCDNDDPDSQMSVKTFFAGTDNKQAWEKVNYKSLKDMIAKNMKKRCGEGGMVDDDASSEMESTDQHPIPPRDRRLSQAVANEIVNTFPKVKVKNSHNSICTKHLICVIDCEGQASFLNIAPALQRYNSVNILVHKLSESLDEKSAFQHNFEKKLTIEEPSEQQLTNFQYLESSFYSLTSVSPSAPPKLDNIEYYPESQNDYNLLIVGTYMQGVEESGTESYSEQRSKELLSDLKPLTDRIISYCSAGDNIIFPVNLAARDPEVISRLRMEIEHHSIKAKIPARWFLLQLHLEQYLSEESSTPSNMVVTKDMCVKFGKELKMEEDEVELALKYYNDLTIFLYFHQILDDVVFLHPEAIISKLSDLIAISFVEVANYFQTNNVPIHPNGAHKKLKDEGIFAKELLGCLKFDGIFTADKFLYLMKHLCIIMELPKSNEYFLPCVLPTASIEKIRSLRKKVSKNVDPLALCWSEQTTDMLPLPQGLFGSLVANLLKLEQKFKLEVKKGFMYSNIIRMACIEHGGGILLIDSVYWLEICYWNRPENCSSIRRIIRKEIDHLIEKFKYKYVESYKRKPYDCFLCNCSEDSSPRRDHLFRLDGVEYKGKKYGTCCSDSFETKELDDSKVPWFSITDVLKECPQLPDLLNLLDKNNMTPEYQRIGAKLRVDVSALGLPHLPGFYFDNLSRVLDKWIKHGNDHNHPETYCPVTWDKIIEVIESISYDKANKIKEFLRYN